MSFIDEKKPELEQRIVLTPEQARRRETTIAKAREITTRRMLAGLDYEHQMNRYRIQ